MLKKLSLAERAKAGTTCGQTLALADAHHFYLYFVQNNFTAAGGLAAAMMNGIIKLNRTEGLGPVLRLISPLF